MGTYGRHAGLFLKRKQTNKQTGLTEKKSEIFERVFLPIEFGLSFNKVGGATVMGFELGDVMM